MKLLILGGTKFVGRHITSTALLRGHTVTLFNRRQTNTHLFPDVEKISGNRDGGLDALRGRTWDAVLDVNGYLPRLVRASAEFLADAVEQYLYISTISVYADFSRPGQTEDAPIAQIPDPTTEVIDGATYGALKALCEQAAQKVFLDRTLILRPGYVVGPYDHTDRMTCWWRRVTRGGEMLLPGHPDNALQLVDGRDLAAFAIDMMERRATGIYNTHGFADRLSWGECFDKARVITGTDTEFTWVGEGLLRAQGVNESDLPLFAFSEDAGISTFDNHQAIAAGMHFRPIADTIRDTLLWDATEGQNRIGLKPEREAALLKAWHEQSG